jgi:uncharacterized protein HemX
MIEAALKIRSSPPAVEYRRWSRNLVEKMSGDIDALQHAAALVASARHQLTLELERSYGAHPASLVRRVSRLASADQVISLASGNFGALATNVPRAAGILDMVDARLTKRNLALLLSLARDRREVDSLDRLLAGVFGQRLGADGLRGLRRLRAEQEALVTRPH